MLRKLLLVGVILFAAGILHAQTTPPLGTDHGIGTSWAIPAGTTQWPAVYCSSTVTTSCIVGYTVTINPPAGGGTAATGTVTGATYTYSWQPGGQLYCGTWNIGVVANWLDSAGKGISSSQITTSVNEPCPFVASPATNLKSTLIP